MPSPSDDETIIVDPDLGAVMKTEPPDMRLADGSPWVSYYDNLFRVIDGTMHVREHLTRRSRYRPLHQMDN